MKQNRNLIEKIIKFGNAYASGYTVQTGFGASEEFSPSQIQVFEYILESEDKNENMSEIARRLGVSRSLLSKNVKILTNKGMLDCFADAFLSYCVKKAPEKPDKDILIPVNPKPQGAVEKADQ